MKEFTFITGNREKIAIMESLLESGDIQIDHMKIDIPEIQASTVQEVAEYSALYAATEINKPCVVTDAGCEIKALGGFPGPFIKFINNQISAEHVLKMMKDEDDREIVFMETLSYAEPSGFVKSFTVYHKGLIAMEKGGNPSLFGKPTPFNEITIFEDCDKVMAAYSYDEMVQYFETRHGNYIDFAYWLKAKKI